MVDEKYRYCLNKTTIEMKNLGKPSGFSAEVSWPATVNQGSGLIPPVSYVRLSSIMKVLLPTGLPCLVIPYFAYTFTPSFAH